MSSDFFIKLMDNDLTKELLQDKNVFVLLTQIALRARRKDGFVSCNGVQVFLNKGQAFIGDYKNIGLTYKEYWNAKKRLNKRQLVSFQGNNRGTIATLLNSDIYDITMSNSGTSRG